MHPKTLREEIAKVGVVEGVYPTAWRRHEHCPCDRGPLSFKHPHSACEAARKFAMPRRKPTFAMRSRRCGLILPGLQTGIATLSKPVKGDAALLSTNMTSSAQSADDLTIDLLFVP